MSRVWMLLGLAIGCGPVVTAGDGDDTGTGADDDDDRGDDRPGTGPSPSTSPTTPTPVDDDGGESDVDDGWKPDFGEPAECSDAVLADCYDVFTHEGYSDDAERIAVGDVDLDGWSDLLSTGSDRDQVDAPDGWIFVHPGGVDPWGDRVETWMTLPYQRELVITDVVGPNGHGDGNPDLVGANNNELIVSPGDGDGRFGQWTAVVLPGDTRRPRAADVDGDGAVEVVTALSEGRIAIVRSFDPVTPEVEILAAPIEQIDELEVGSFDFSGEGVEILVAGSSADQHSFAAALYDDAVSGDWEVSPLQTDTVGFAVRDYNHDGANDLATASGSSAQAHMYVGSGDGTLGVPALVDLAGEAELAAGGQFGPTVQGLATLVDGTLTIVDFEIGAATVLVGPEITRQFIAEDINQDGLTDIVASIEYGFNVVVFLSHP
jgi:hypothetical protein